MVEQPPNKRENVSPGYESVFSLGQKPYDQTFFLFLEKVSLSSISGQKDFVTLSNFASLSSLASLGKTTAPLCQTTAPLCPSSLRSRKVKLSRGKKIGLHFLSVPGTHFPRPREYIFLPTRGGQGNLKSFFSNHQKMVGSRAQL